MSGFSVAAARLGKPDTGLLSYYEMLEQGRCMHEATGGIPIIGDGDTGYGNAMNVKRTVLGYSAAGFAGILIEDQQWPKSCGHVRGKKVIPRDEAVARVKAACDARDEGPNNIVIVARTDARQAESFDEALARASAFADVGADVVFVDALESEKEMRTLCVQVQGGVHKMANMLEGGGKTPILSPEELEEMGFKLCAYPLSLVGVSVTAMRRALEGLKRGTVPVVGKEMPAFTELQDIIGFNAYFAEDQRYAVGSSGSATSTSSTVDYSNTTNTNTTKATPAVEPDRVIDPYSIDMDDGTGNRNTSTDISRTIDASSDSSDPRSPPTRRSQWLRIKVSNAATGAVQLDTKFPAGFLAPVAAIVPQVAGLDLEGLIRGGGSRNSEQQGEGRRRGDPIFSFEDGVDRIDIYLEDQ